MKKIMSLFALLGWAVCCVNVGAQENRAALGGLVTDQHGAAIAGASVIVTSDDTGVRQETKTNEQGRWSVHFLNPGHYSITVSYTGFRTAERKGLTLDTADDKTVDMALQVGSVSEQVVVEAETPLIDTTSATSGTVISPKMMTEMPLMSRIPTLLAVMAPGVLLYDQNNNVARMWSVNAASDIQVNGGRGLRSNEFLIDGTPDEKKERIAFIPPLDSIQEFRVMTNAYDAQYGRQAGGTINMSVRSGTKSYHGSLYEFNQNNFLNAAFFQAKLQANPTTPPVHYNLYGGTIGGPVRIPKVYNGKDKTFFFFTYEGTRNQDPRGGIFSLPTEKQRNGDFSDSFTIVNGRRFPILIYDPTTLPDSANPNTDKRTPFTASSNPASPDYNAACTPATTGYNNGTCPNIIPSAGISPIAKKILDFVPLPNKVSEPTGDAVNNYVSPATRNNKMASVVTRVDRNWNNEHKTFVSVRWNHETEILGDHFQNVSTGDGPNKRINYQAGLDHVWTISPSRVLDVRYAVTRWEEPTQSHGKGFDPTALGFPASYVSQMRCESFPRFNIFGNIGGGCGGYFKTLYHNWNVSLTQTYGKMTFHYGGEFRILQEANAGFGNQSGSFDFGDQWTRQIPNTGGGTGIGSGYASFLLGLPTGGSFPRNADSYDSMHYYGLFFQNDWRITRNLTLNLGLRWDYEHPFTERFNRLTSNFDPTVLNPISNDAQASYAQILSANANNPVYQELARLQPASSFQVYGAQLFAGVAGQSRTAVQGDFQEWQPRVGFAYRLLSKTVIRGGFGRFVQGTALKGRGDEDSDGQNGFSVSTPFIATANNWLTPVDTLANPFQNGILEPPGSSLGPLTNLGQGVDWDNQHAGRPYSWEYSLHLQQEYKGWLFEIGYSHNKTYDIYWDLNQNNPSFALWQQLFAPRFADPACVTNPPGPPSCLPNDKFLGDETITNPFQRSRLPAWGQYITGGIGSNTTRSFWDLLRPLKLFGNQNRRGNPWGKNQYDAMLVRVERRFKGGFSLLSAFTWSKLFEDTSFWGPEISGPITEHKLGGEDRPFRLSIASVYELPVGRGKSLWGSMPRAIDAVLGGWETSGQYLIQSGAPAVFGANSFYDGQDFHLPRGQRTLDRWFDTSHFRKFPGKNDPLYDCSTGARLFPDWTGVYNLPGANWRPAPADCGKSDKVQNGVYKDFGTYVRRTPTRWGNVRVSRVNEVNLGVFKNFSLTERVKMQFRFESFNAFNHVRFPGPETNPGNANFGRVRKEQLNSPRLVQMALKLTF